MALTSTPDHHRSTQLVVPGRISMNSAVASGRNGCSRRRPYPSPTLVPQRVVVVQGEVDRLTLSAKYGNGTGPLMTSAAVVVSACAGPANPARTMAASAMVRPVRRITEVVISTSLPGGEPAVP